MRKDAESSGEIGGGEAAGTVAGLVFEAALLTEQAEAYRLFPLDQNPRETMSLEENHRETQDHMLSWIDVLDGHLRSVPF